MTIEELKNEIRTICRGIAVGCDGCPIFPLVDDVRTACIALAETKKHAVEAAIKAYRNSTDPTQKAPDTRREILQAAERCVCGDRDNEYGGPENSFALIAELWEPIIRARCVSPGADVSVDAVTVALLMAALKIARAATNTGHMDSWVDLAGYAACGGEIAAKGADADAEA